MVNLNYVYARYLLAKGHFRKAKQALETCLEYMEQSGVKESKCDVLTLFAEIYESTSEIEKAYLCLIEADEFAFDRHSPIEHSSVLLQRARININRENYFESIMLLKETKRIAEKSENYYQKYTCELLFARTYLLLYKFNIHKKSYYDQANRHLVNAIKLVGDHNLIPKYLQALSIQGLFYLIREDQEKAALEFQKAQQVAKKHNLKTFIQKNSERLAFTLRKPSKIGTIRDLDLFFLQLTLEDLQEITSSFIQQHVTSLDIDNTFSVVYLVDNEEQVNIHASYNIPLEDKVWYNQILQMGNIYSSAFGQVQNCGESVFGPFPFGNDFLRTILFCKLVNHDTPIDSDEGEKKCLIFSLVFHEKISSLFTQKDRLQPIFENQFALIENISQITEEFLAKFRNVFFSTLLKDLKLTKYAN